MWFAGWICTKLHPHWITITIRPPKTFLFIYLFSLSLPNPKFPILGLGPSQIRQWQGTFEDHLLRGFSRFRWELGSLLPRMPSSFRRPNSANHSRDTLSPFFPFLFAVNDHHTETGVCRDFERRYLSLLVVVSRATSQLWGTLFCFFSPSSSLQPSWPISLASAPLIFRAQET